MFRVAICDDVHEVCETLGCTVRQCCEKECVDVSLDTFTSSNDYTRMFRQEKNMI